MLHKCPSENQYDCPALYLNCFSLAGNPLTLDVEGKDGMAPLLSSPSPGQALALPTCDPIAPVLLILCLKVAPDQAMICPKAVGVWVGWETTPNPALALPQQGPLLPLLPFAHSRPQLPLPSAKVLRGSSWIYTDLKIHILPSFFWDNIRVEFCGEPYILHNLIITWNGHLCLFVYLFIICHLRCQ